jgi:CheY-like chemotaxis protein
MPSQKSALLVNSDQDFLASLAPRIQQLGVEVSTATNGLDAAMRAATELPDLIVMSVDLPDTDGLTVCGKLRQNPVTSGIPVIILTHRTDQGTLDLCSSLGMQHVHNDQNYWLALGPMVCGYLGVVPVQEDPANAAGAAGGPAAGAPRILVIDDDRQIRQALMIRLGALGFHVVDAPSASSGNYLAWTECPDLIITDQNMPEMSGENLIVKLKNDEETKDIPIIVITGQTHNGGEDQALKREMLGRRGAVAYLTKPVDFDDLVRVINSHIQNPLPAPQSAKSAAR